MLSTASPRCFSALNAGKITLTAGGCWSLMVIVSLKSCGLLRARPAAGAKMATRHVGEHVRFIIAHSRSRNTVNAPPRP